jgi:CDP-diacylglycerol---glycerol-3-phosphate 3-phosphatidyltransferase
MRLPRGRLPTPYCERDPLVRSPAVEAGALRATQRGPARASALILAGTSTRIVATPVVMALVVSHSYTAAAIVFIVVSATDWFDGRLARRWGVSSRVGSFLDTTADKLLVAGALIALVAVDRASPWIALIIIGREMVVLGLRAAVAAQGSHLEASMLGKWKATVQFVAIALVMLRPDVVIGGVFLDQWVLIAAAIVTAWSGVDYFVSFSSALRDGT